MQECPECKVQHLDGVDLCDCGYRFSTGEFEAVVSNRPPNVGASALGARLLSMWGGACMSLAYAPVPHKAGLVVIGVFAAGFLASDLFLARRRRLGKSLTLVRGLGLAIGYLFVGIAAMVLCDIAVN